MAPVWLSIVTTSRERLHQLRQTLPGWVGQDGVQAILVDDQCPQGSGAWAEKTWPGCTVVRQPRPGPFNISRARNFGASHARAPSLCFVDADTCVDAGFTGALRAGWQPGAFFVAAASAPELAGVIACSRADFERIGGYDETFEGWGCEDRDLQARLARAGCQRLQLPDTGLRALAHSDSERTRHHAIADRFLSLRINGLYFQVKNDLARLTRRIDLAPADRQALYALVRRQVLADVQAPARLEVPLAGHCDFMQPPGWQLRRSIRYEFEPLAPTAPGAP